MDTLLQVFMGKRSFALKFIIALEENKKNAVVIVDNILIIIKLK